MLVQHRRHWATIKPAQKQCLQIAGLVEVVDLSMRDDLVYLIFALLQLTHIFQPYRRNVDAIAIIEG